MRDLAMARLQTAPTGKTCEIWRSRTTDEWDNDSHTPVVQDRLILNLRDLAISRYGGMERLIPNGRNAR